jgi:hypothetical protein
VEHEHSIVGDLHRLGEIDGRLDVDHACRVVAKDPEVVGQLDVDRRWLHAALVERLDDDASERELFTEGVVGEDHGSTVPNTLGNSTVACPVVLAPTGPEQTRGPRRPRTGQQ